MFFDILKRLDRILFVLIHNDSDHKILDGVMLITRDPVTWIPLFIFMVFYIIKYKKAKALSFLSIALATVAINYTVTTVWLQPLFGRLSPCRDPQLQKFLRGIIACSNRYSFPSSYSASLFGLVIFWICSFQFFKTRKWILFLIWVFFLCYAQIYVGRNFPFDIIAGAILGSIIGLLMSKIYKHLPVSRQKHFPKKYS